MKNDLEKARRWALVLLFASGAAGLAHQVVWTRRLVDVLGASPETFSRVVGAFCIGLSLGGAWSAIRPSVPAIAWRRVAMAELAVALLGGIVLAALPLADALRSIPGTGTGIRWGLPLLLIIPPAAAMGLVLPAVLTALAEPRLAVRAYGINTLGGVGGILLTVFLSLPALGLLGAGLTACGISVSIGLTALFFHRRRPQTNPSACPTTTPEESQAPGIPPQAGILAFASGFLVLALEVIAQQQFAQVTINSHFSSAAILAVVLLALFAGSWVIHHWESSAQAGKRVGKILLLACGLWLFQPVVFLLLRPGLEIIPYELPPLRYFSQVGQLSALTLAPGFLASGLLFPLLLRTAPTPRIVARWLALNGLGGWMGAEAAQSLLLPVFGLWQGILAVAGVYLALGLWAPGAPTHPASAARWNRFLQGSIALLLILALLALWRPYGRWPLVHPAPGERVVEVEAGSEGVVATVVRDTNDWRIVFNNTYTLGGSRAKANQERQAHLPLLLHGHPESVALLGVATGSTLAGAALHPEVTRLDAFELSPLAARFARQHFAPFNRAVFDDPRVRVQIEDARWGIGQSPGAYDVVIGDLFLPWRTGEGRLFSREHFATVRRALRPDGLFCQWLPLFQLTRSQYDCIARTFLAEFPHAFLIRGDFYPELPILGLCGFADGRSVQSIDWPRVAVACERLRTTPGGVTDPLARHAGGVAMCVLGELPPPPPGPLNTLGNSHLEWDAGGNIIGLRFPWFIGVPLAEYLRDTVRASSGSLPPELAGAQDSGQFFLTLEVANAVRAPVLNNLRSQVRDRLPEALRSDPQADWTQWPGRVKPFAADR